jgi:nucleotide-binding universal stress UspA family protein
LDAAGTVQVPLDPELVSEVDEAGEHHAAVVARDGARLADSLGLDAEPHAIPDEVHVADAIADFAAERDVAAVVGSHGISGLRSHLLGSTSRQLLARCRRPIVVVRAEEDR